MKIHFIDDSKKNIACVNNIKSDKISTYYINKPKKIFTKNSKYVIINHEMTLYLMLNITLMSQRQKNVLFLNNQYYY